MATFRFQTDVHAAQPGAISFAPVTRHAPPNVCVIAEIGVNHDGDVNKAIELAEAAKRAGANAIKLQLFDPAMLLSNQAALADYQKASDSDVYEMLDRLKLCIDDMVAVRLAARRLNIGFVVTPFSLEMYEAARQLDVDAIKIASPDVVNLPLLRCMASLKKPIIVSTGTSELSELRPAVQIIRDQPSCLLHCVSSYPTPAEDASLGAIGAIATRYALPVGYSDHTNEIMTGALAVAAGACVIEKHLTYDRNAAGPDHAASFDPTEFKQYVALVRQSVQMLGARCKAVANVEREVREICRQSICITRDLPAGHVITQADITVKRPGTGIPASEMDAVIGRTLTHDVHANDLLRTDDLAA